MSSKATNTSESIAPVTGADLTRQRILEAACHLFTSRGYRETGVRDICAMAGVNQALVPRYFGSKLGLFEKVLFSLVDVTVFTDLERPQFGQALADAFCGSPAEAAMVVPTLLYAAGDSAAKDVALKVLHSSIIAPLEKWFGTADAEDRVAQVLVVVTGFYTYRLMLPLEPMQGKASNGVREWLARTLQEIVDRP